MRSLEWDLIQSDWCLYKRRKFGHRDTRGALTQSKGHVRTWGEADVCRPKRERPQEKPGLLAP